MKRGKRQGRGSEPHLNIHFAPGEGREFLERGRVRAAGERWKEPLQGPLGLRSGGGERSLRDEGERKKRESGA